MKLNICQTVKRFTSLKAFFFLRLLFGHYYNISKSHVVCYLTKMFCVGVSMSVLFLYFKHYVSTSVINQPNIFAVGEFLCNTALSLNFTEEFFFKFFSAIKTGDTIMGFKQIPYIPRYMCPVITVIVLFRILISFLRYVLDSSKIYLNLTIYYVLISMDLNNILIAVIFSLLHSRMKLLRQFLEKNTIPVTITRMNKAAASVKNTRKSLYNYYNLLDSILLINKQLQYMLLVCLVANFPKMVLIINVTAKQFVRRNTISTLSNITEYGQFLYILCCPALLSELIIYEVEKVRATLTKQLVRCSDPSLRCELEGALQYVWSRPWSYALCRVVPLDLNLPLLVFTLVITYSIVVIQFTNL